jgi:hypothetical protein
MCCTIGMSGDGGGGLFAWIDSYLGYVSDSSMSLTTVTATNNTAAGTMRWALLWQHDLWVVPVDSDGLCVCVRDGGLVCGVWAVLREQATLLRIGHRGTLMVCARTPGATMTRPLMFSRAEAEVIVPWLAFVYFQQSK